MSELTDKYKELPDSDPYALLAEGDSLIDKQDFRGAAAAYSDGIEQSLKQGVDNPEHLAALLCSRGECYRLVAMRGPEAGATAALAEATRDLYNAEISIGGVSDAKFDDPFNPHPPDVAQQNALRYLIARAHGMADLGSAVITGARHTENLVQLSSALSNLTRADMALAAGVKPENPLAHLRLPDPNDKAQVKAYQAEILLLTSQDRRMRRAADPTLQQAMQIATQLLDMRNQHPQPAVIKTVKRILQLPGPPVSALVRA